MSSVSGSNSTKRQDDTVRRNREEYQGKESELVKKHHKELSRITEQHYQELEKLKEAHEAQLREMQEASRKAITQRDQRYQGDIESLRQMHRNQLKSTSEEAQRRESLTSGTSRSELDQNRIQTEARIQQLNSEFEAAMKAKDASFQESLIENREAQKRGMADQKAKLEKAHQEEVKFLREDRDQRIAALRNEYDAYRKTATAEKKHQNLQNFQNQKRASDSMMRAVGKEREARVQSEEILRDGFEEGLGNVREKYEKAMAKERAASQMGRNALEGDVRTRVESRISRLESENMDLKDVQVRDQLDMKRKKEREVSNIRDSFTKNIENLQMQRDEAIRQGKERNREDILNLSKRNSELLTNATRSNLQKLEDKDFIHRSDRDQLENSLTAHATQSKTFADQRVKSIVTETEMSKLRMSEKAAESHKIQQQSHADEIRALRFAMEDEKRTAIDAIKALAQKKELRHQEQLSEMQSKHKAELNGLKDQLLLLKRENDEALKRTVAELQRAHNLSLEQQEARHKGKLQNLEVDHSNQLKTVNRRNEEKVQNMSAAITKKT